MRIGIDARLWNETGVGRYIRNLVWQLEKIDTQNEYVLFVKKGSKKQELRIKNDRFKIVETDIHWHTAREQLQLPKVLQKENLDLVHFPYFSVPIFYRKPYVVTIHDLIIHHFPTGEASTHHPLVYHGKRFGYEYIMKKAAQKSKKIITVSNATKNEIIDHLDISAEKIVVTYEGVDESLKTKVKQSTTRDEKYFLYVGNAYPHKNLERLLSAFKEVSVQRKNVKLFLVGKNDYFYTKVQKRIDDLDLMDLVKIFHNVSDEKLHVLYANALGVVLPSLMEGFGLPAVEAMAHLQKLIVSDIPAFREICADAGIYFDPNDTEDLTKKLMQIIDDPENPMYLKNIKAGVARLEQFSWETMARDILHVYESALSSEISR